MQLNPSEISELIKSRIQNLDAVQNVLHRMLGVVEVRVEHLVIEGDLEAR